MELDEPDELQMLKDENDLLHANNKAMTKKMADQLEKHKDEHLVQLKMHREQMHKRDEAIGELEEQMHEKEEEVIELRSRLR